MKYEFRVDAPAEIRKAHLSVGASGYTGFAALAAFMALAGAIALLFLALGDSLIGSLVCVAWIVWQALTIRWAVRKRRAVNAWLAPIRIDLGDHYIRMGEKSFWQLEPETRSNYGVPLMQAMYRLAAIDVRGDVAGSNLRGKLDDRSKALSALVDAEDKKRLYAADPLLADRDDIDAAKLWQKAVAKADQYLRENEQ